LLVANSQHAWNHTVKAGQRGAPWVAGELARLRHLSGVHESVTGASEPYASALTGDADGAAEHWSRLGCPYDAALARVASEKEADLRFALHRAAAAACPPRRGDRRTTAP
jgi:hypothetical protein